MVSKQIPKSSIAELNTNSKLLTILSVNWLNFHNQAARGK